MKRVIHSINLTVSGSCDHADTVADEEHHRYALQLLESASDVLLGRNTFDLFHTFWPTAATRSDLSSYMTEFAAALDAKPKHVLSTRSLETTWRNTHLLHGPELDEVRRLIGGPPGVVIVFGSPGLASSLVGAGLVHEIHVVLQPFIGTAPKRAFETLTTTKKLVLLDARPFPSGAVLLRYASDA
jgi:dihydrofolate reductase